LLPRIYSLKQGQVAKVSVRYSWVELYPIAAAGAAQGCFAARV
jgi:hypothetical protein